jgi:hypothetical protein
MINRIRREKLVEISNASAKILPDNPTGRGMSPDDIRRRFWEPIVSKGNSLAEEIDRVAEEANVDIEAAVTKAAEELSDEKSARETSENGIREDISAVSKALDTHKAEVSVEAVDKTIPRRTSFGTLEAETKRISTIQYPEERQKEQLVNLGFFDAEMDAHKADVEKTFNTLEAQIAGKTRSYVVDNASTLNELLSGVWYFAGGQYYTDDFETGDNIYVVDNAIPDFWFEKTEDFSRVETITIDGEEVELVVYAYGDSGGGPAIGILHILESDNVNLGDLDRVLDSIIAYQEQLIGGDA